MEAMVEQWQLKLEKARAYYHNKKATDEAFAKKLNEEARKRHERRRAKDPAYAVKRREYSRAQNERRKEAGALLAYRELCEKDVENTVMKTKRIYNTVLYKKMWGPWV